MISAGLTAGSASILFLLNLEEGTFLTFAGIFCHRSVAT